MTRYDNREPSHKRGYDWKWKKVRDMKIAMNPLCEVCAEDGKVKRANTVHHIKPVAKYPELRLVMDNLVSMCRECHEETEGRVKAGYDKNGWPLSESHPWKQ